MLIDEFFDCGLQLGDGAMDAVLDLVFGEQREKPFDLVDPGGARGRQVDVPA